MRSSIDVTTSYLIYGYHKKVITDAVSDWNVVNRIVPEETNLGPLFLTYVLVTKNTCNCLIIKHADDTLFSESEKT